MPELKTVSSVIVGKKFVFITSLNLGMNVVSLWYKCLAVMLSLPNSDFNKAVSNSIRFGGSDALQNLHPANRAISPLAVRLSRFCLTAKLSGFIVTEQWQIDTETGKWKQKRKTIGYYESKKEDLQALADYNKSPYDVDASMVTFQEVFDRWSEEHFPTVSESNAKGYREAYLLCEPIANKRMADVKLDDLQYIADTSGKNTPTLRKYKVLAGLMFKYAVIHDIIPPDMNKTQYIDIKKAGNR